METIDRLGRVAVALILDARKQLGIGLCTKVGTLLVLALLAVALTCPLAALAHSGGLDKYGCHHDNKVGDYRYHSGPFKDRSFPSQQDMLAQLQS